MALRVFNPGDEVVVRVGGGTLNTGLFIGSWCLTVAGLFDPIVSGQVTCTLLEAGASNAEVRCSRATSGVLSLSTFLLRLLMSDHMSISS